MDIWHRKNSLWQAKVILLLLVMLGMGFIMFIPVDTSAQGLPTPTPRGNGGGGGSGSSGSGSGQDGFGGVSAGDAALSGFVYNYSTNTYEGGITVIVTGDGWETEAVSDSNGYYRIGNLGSGRGVVNLRLPPGTHPVVVDWPVWTYESASLKADMGFYWGDTPPMPVLLLANLEGNVLTVQVENLTSAVATGGVIEVETPGQITISPAVDMIQGGATMAYDAHQPQLDVSDISPGDEVLMRFTLTGVLQSIEGDLARVTFTYDQQYTPQVVVVRPKELQPITASAGMMALEQSDSEQSERANVQATPQPEATPVPNSANTSSESEAGTEDTAENTEPTPLPQLPKTGIQTSTASAGTLIFSMVLVVGLIGAGWWSVRSGKLFHRDE